ncbi:MAG: hypothetical protein HRU11_01630 [Parvularculaceae bacterium]|nr:hypothetical protein [Parvularculaceae bacterium]
MTQISNGNRSTVYGKKAALMAVASTLALATSAYAQTETIDTDGALVSKPADADVLVADAPAVVIDANDVVLTNAGRLATSGVTQTIQINDGTTDTMVKNQQTGEIVDFSRAVDVRGDNATVANAGLIGATGDQRNGVIYTNDTANGFTIQNQAPGSIDPGSVYSGAAISISLDPNNPTEGTITNAGSIAGRGNAGAGTGLAGDGIRFETVRAGGALGVNAGTFEGDITNAGTISSDGANGTVAGIRFVNGVSFDGRLTNEVTGVISGTQNGVYFGNAIPAGGGDFSNANLDNFGTISSGSRALNIDGDGLTVINSGSILGTGNQRNGTIYADSTAQNFRIANSGLIDAGVGNQGAAFSVELTSTGNDFTIDNSGHIYGRGQASAGAATAGDGLRFERTRVGGALDGTTSGLFTGDIINSGVIASESAQGTAGGIRFVNGVSFSGEINNSGTIKGVQNGLYFGNPTPAGGGDFTGAVVNNTGTISSGSRALNIDGRGLSVNNDGYILSTGNQRNGTVYVDGTANAFTVNNRLGGVVDAGKGNNGSGVSIQVGAADGATQTFSLNNKGTIAGRGDSLPSGEAAGLRLFGGAANTSAAANITNTGKISSETSAAVLIEGVDFTGTFTNGGELYGPRAFDASAATGGVNFVQVGGSLKGSFEGSGFADSIEFAGGRFGGEVNLNGGDDIFTLISDALSGGTTRIDFGDGSDTFAFSLDDFDATFAETGAFAGILEATSSAGTVSRFVLANIENFSIDGRLVSFANLDGVIPVGEVPIPGALPLFAGSILAGAWARRRRRA